MVTRMKKKLNLLLMIRLITVQITIIILYFPMLFLPVKLNFPYIYKFGHYLALLACRIKVINLTGYDLKKVCPAVFACAHKCFIDPCIVGFNLDAPHTFTMSKHVLNIIKPFWIIAWKMKFVPIDRNDLYSFKYSLLKIEKNIKKDFSLVYFPEGYYSSPDVPTGPLESGITMIARSTGAKIVPLAIYGISQDFAYDTKLVWKKVYIKAGEPMDYTSFNNKALFKKELSKRIESLYFQIKAEVEKK